MVSASKCSVTMVKRVDLSSGQCLRRQVICTRAVRKDSGMCRPESHMTGGWPPPTQSRYCERRSSKCWIQDPRGFSVLGALAAHMAGRKPLKRASARASSSSDMPISPLSARERSASDESMVATRMFQRSSSWSSTICVGVGVAPSKVKRFLMFRMSSCSGTLPCTSSMVDWMTDSRDTPSPPPAERGWRSMRFRQRSLEACMK
mmetsp:Transcript_23307/g.88391  ORF Transcript_23307/g.88391 Transcript_23307/m.88391 type:complete len:204 (+) Transcript_23307:449-1060(+)